MQDGEQTLADNPVDACYEKNGTKIKRTKTYITMDYEKKYKEALEWMKKLYPTMTGAIKEDAEHHFPELAETEDEKIRKTLIPAWSEEDSKRLQRIIDFLWCNRKGDTDTIYQQEQDIDWLKSLKDRYTWKPSDEQIKAIRLARSFITDDFDEHPTLSEILIGLEEQLKKLKE